MANVKVLDVDPGNIIQFAQCFNIQVTNVCRRVWLKINAMIVVWFRQNISKASEKTNYFWKKHFSRKFKATRCESVHVEKIFSNFTDLTVWTFSSTSEVSW